MSYVPVPIGISLDKLHSLGRGSGVRLSASHIGTGTTVHMTRRQANKAMRHHRSGKGMILRLSAAQLRHHQKGGADWTGFSKAARLRGEPIVRLPKEGGGVQGRGVMGGAIEPKRVGRRKIHAGQQAHSADHPITTSFERDPLPGEHYAIPQ